MDNTKISSLFSSRFSRALTTRSFATCWNVNAVMIYFMKLILASWCVGNLSCDSQVLFF